MLVAVQSDVIVAGLLPDDGSTSDDSSTLWSTTSESGLGWRLAAETIGMPAAFAACALVCDTP